MSLPPELVIAGAFVTAFFVTYISIPSIVKVAHKKRLFDTPGQRTVHKHATPTLGGIAIFVGFVIALTLWNIAPKYQTGIIISGVIIMFFIGLKDDILIIAPKTKMGGQVVAALLVAVLGDIRISSLHGFYGMTDIPYALSIFLSVFVIIVIMNGINLIDGIDGLSSGIGILTATTFGIWFFLVEAYFYALVAASLIGGLIAFFRFNVFGRQNKIFMGDTGSLIVGIILAVLTIQFNELNIVEFGKYRIHAAPAVSFGILIVPLFDILRVMFIRIIINQSPFKPDKNHIHHKLLALGCSHLKATLIILFFNILFIIFVFTTCQSLEILRLMLLLLILAMVFSYIPALILEKRKQTKKNS